MASSARNSPNGHVSHPRTKKHRRVSHLRHQPGTSLLQVLRQGCRFAKRPADEIDQRVAEHRGKSDDAGQQQRKWKRLPSHPDSQCAKELRIAAAHAGRAFQEGANAVAGAAIIAARLHALNGQREGVTVNVAKISGGGALNVVADNAVVRFNVRVPDKAAADWIDASVRAIAATPPFEGLTLDLHGGFTRAPKPMDASQTALFHAVRDAGELLGQTIAWKPSGGVCEGNNLHAAGLPNVDTLGVVGGEIHSDQEFAWPASFVERAQLSALILCKIASGEIDALKLKQLRLETM